MSIAHRVKDCLSRRQLSWEALEHARSASCAEAARSAHVPPDRLAKAIVLQGNSRYLMAVIPANHRLRMEDLCEALGDDLHLAGERALDEFFADCESGAIPPLGFAYGIPTFWDEKLASRGDVYFEGGDHMTLVRMNGREFGALMREASKLPEGCN